LQEDKLIRKLSCTALCWFILDAIFYGNTLFTPLVLEKAFGTRESINDSMRDAIILSSIALPGYYVSVLTIGYQTPIWVQSQGFLLMCLLYGLLGLNFDYLANANKSFLLLLYGLTFFFSNYGPNTTTFMLPSLTFSPGCRSTLNGICAACGKMGALAGATLFVHIAAKFGDVGVMFLCSGLSLMGLFFTRYGVDSVSYLKRKRSCSSLISISEENA
jgi:PHS family inorganic phosphate transporter-like MFS transporter